MVVYRIAKWREVFEKSESRKLKTTSWVSLPIAFSSSGYHSLLDEFGDDAAAIYGCWCALLLIAAGCNVRGMLADSRGNPLRISWIARTSGLPVGMFERLVAWASTSEVGWLEKVEADSVQSLIAENQANSLVSCGLGESPTNPPESWQNSRATEQNRTLQNKTSHHTTSHYTTEQPASVDAPGGESSVSVGGVVAVGNPNVLILRDRWDRLRRTDEKFVEEVVEMANRLRNLKYGVLKGVERRRIWEWAWAGLDLDGNVLRACFERIATRQVEKPAAYLDGAMRKLCTEKSQCRWDDVRSCVPEPPSKPVETEAA
jgi:hypothetical protein